MEDITRPKYSCNPISSPSSKLAMHRDSHVISNKFKPKVRIIHIFAPEIIKTDVENFRELVQRLTGKPGDNLDDLQTGKSRSSSSRRNNKTTNSPCCKKLMMVKKKSASFSSCESNSKNMLYQDFGLSNLMKDEKLKMEDPENEIWGGNSSNFLDGFADFNGFIHGLSDDISITTRQSSHMDVFGDLHFT